MAGGDDMAGGLFALLNSIGNQVEQQGRQITQISRDFSTFQATLGDHFTPRRETESLDKRLIAVEEWRLAQTQREGDRLASLQQQINVATVQMQQQVNASTSEMEKRLANVQRGSQHDLTSTNRLNDDRWYDFLKSLGMVGLGAILAYIFSGHHIP